MRLEPLYVARFAYPEGWGMTLEGPHGSEGNYLFIAEGRVEGAITGRLRGVNHPRSRVDGSALPDVQGAIETDDGAVVLFDWRGFARPYPEERRQIVVSGTHLSQDERYARLNDAICVGTGEIRPVTGGGPRQVVGHQVEFVIEVAELIWEPLAGS
jgi:hypothetical protein